MTHNSNSNLERSIDLHPRFDHPRWNRRIGRFERQTHLTVQRHPATRTAGSFRAHHFRVHRTPI